MTQLSSQPSSRVSLVRCASYDPAALRQAMGRALEHLGGPGRFIRPGQKVLLKPNVMMPKPFGFAANTHPEFVRAVIGLFQGAGAEVWVGESSAGSQAGLTLTKKALAASGLDKVASETGARLINFDLDGVVTAKLGNRFAESVPIARAVRDADLVVSLPKLKTHTFANIITGAVKNLYGCVPGQIKAEFHRRAPRPKEFFTIVRDVYGYIRPGLAIFDAVEAMEGNGPSAGSPRAVGLIIAGADSVAADAVASEVINVPSLRVMTTRLCHEAGLGAGDLKKIDLAGEPLESVRVADFVKPTTAVVNPYLYRAILKLTETVPVIDADKCTRCRVCLQSCPMQAVSEKDGRMVIDRSLCIRCFCCAEVCQEQAVSPKRKNKLGDVLSKMMLKRW